MFSTLVRKELLTNLLTLRLAVAVGFTVVLSVLTTLIGSLDYSRSTAAYQRELRQDQDRLDQPTVYAQVTPTVLVPPKPLSILCRGTTGTAAQRVFLGYDWVPMASSIVAASADSEMMKTLVQIDFATVVTVLLSFLALVLGYDGICGERERGSLQQLLTNPVPRAWVVLAKLAGGVLSLWVPLALASLLSLVLVLANPDVVLSRDDGLRLAVLFGLACLFLAQVYALSLMVSTLVRESDTALITCLLAWLISGVGFLNVLPSLSRYLVSEPPYQEFADQSEQLWREYGQRLEEWEARHPSPGPAYLQGIERQGYLRYAHPRGYDWLTARSAVASEAMVQLADRRYVYEWANQQPLARQALVVDSWAVLSPLANFQVLTYQLAGTTLNDRLELARAAREYRQTWLGWLRGRGAFASRRWFTDDPPDQQPMLLDPAAVTPEMLSPDSPFLQARLAWAEEQEKAAASDPRRRLDLTDMPKFGGQGQRSLASTFGGMLPGLAVLVLVLGGSLLVTLASFRRYDPR